MTQNEWIWAILGAAFLVYLACYVRPRERRNQAGVRDILNEIDRNRANELARLEALKKSGGPIA